MTANFFNTVVHPPRPSELDCARALLREIADDETCWGDGRNGCHCRPCRVVAHLERWGVTKKS